MRKKIIGLMMLMSAVIFANEKEEEFDPSDPTKAQSFWKLELENTGYKGKTDGENVKGGLGGIRVQNQGSYGNLIWQAELPILQAYGDFNKGNQKLSLGDTRLRTFYITHKSEDPDSIYSLFAVSLDAYIPTGSVKNGTGNGMYRFVPSVAAAFKINEKFSFYPILGYGMNTNGSLNSTDFNKHKSQGVYSEIIFSYKFSDKVFLNLTPAYNNNERSSTNGGKPDSFSFKVNLGYKPTPTTAVGIWANIPLNNEPSSSMKKSDYMYNQETIRLYYQFAF